MLDDKDKSVVRALQEDIPLTAAPYATLAASAGMTEDEFLTRARRLQAAGVIRRIGVALRHRRAGFTANALAVWLVPRDRLDAVGAAVAAERAVTHCYARASSPDWQYNFYAMVHEATREACAEIIARITREQDLPPGKVLYTVREWKKASMKYFEVPY